MSANEKISRLESDAPLRISAIILAAGRGRRMGTEEPKQFLSVLGKPLLFYTLAAFEDSVADEVVLVAEEDRIDACAQIVEKGGFRKVCAIVAGGSERVDSVQSGLAACSGEAILVHDGARPLVTPEVIARTAEAVRNGADSVLAAVPVKDTIKVSDGAGFVKNTPDRRFLWAAQTPQAFRRVLLEEAYEKREKAPDEKHFGWTDDVQLVEDMTGVPALLVMGDYQNLKITTPEDLVLMEALLTKRGKHREGRGLTVPDRN